MNREMDKLKKCQCQKKLLGITAFDWNVSY